METVQVVTNGNGTGRTNGNGTGTKHVFKRNLAIRFEFSIQSSVFVALLL